MSPRSIRRAIERKTEKDARKAERAQAAQTQTEVQTPESAQTLANRANAQFSTGPITEAGREKVKLNALKNGLTGRTVLLPSDDAEKYREHIQSFADEWQPATDRECALVQAIADHQWRLNRVFQLEMSIYALGYQKFADDLDDAQQIELNTYLTFEKQLRNLQIQESRLRRYREKDTAELRQLQADRRAKPAESQKPDRQEGAQTQPAAAPNGFEFSTPLYPADAANDFTHSAAASCAKPLVATSQMG